MKNFLSKISNKDKNQSENRKPDGKMSVQELFARFPEIPQDLHDEPVLEKYAASFGDLLKVATNPSACSAQYDATNHFYLKLIGPIRIYMYGLSTKEKVLKQMQELLDRYEADPDGFAASLLPEEVASQEIKGPGCD